MKNKKNVFIAVVSLLVILVFIKFTEKNSKQSVNDESPKEAGENKSSTNLINTPLSIKTASHSQTNNRVIPNKIVKVNEVKDEKFEVFDRIENAWLNKVKDIFGEEKYSLYLDMRNRNEKEKAIAYQAYHDYLRAKFGNNFKYNISEDQSISEKKINEKYLKELLKLVGEDKYKEYLKSIDQFNESTRRQSNGKNFIIMEF